MVEQRPTFGQPDARQDVPSYKLPAVTTWLELAIHNITVRCSL
jgi:hypothetical protein